MILHLAVAMFPDHPHSRRWREVGSELMVSSYARRQDMDDDKTVIDGRTVKDWLRGYNVRDDGAVINHGILHPDYSTSITSVTRAYLTLPLVRKQVPESADFNAAMDLPDAGRQRVAVAALREARRHDLPARQGGHLLPERYRLD